MKKLLAFLAAMMLVLGLFMSCAAAKTTTVYDTTAQFLDILDEKGIKYEYAGLTDDNDEKVRVGWDPGKLDNFDLVIFFTADDLCIRAWNVVNFTCGVDYAYKVCNELNSAWRYARFYVDTSDNSITVATDMALPAGVECGAASYDQFMHISSIIDNATDTLLKMK